MVFIWSVEKMVRVDTIVYSSAPELGKLMAKPLKVLRGPSCSFWLKNVETKTIPAMVISFMVTQQTNKAQKPAPLRAYVLHCYIYNMNMNTAKCTEAANPGIERPVFRRHGSACLHRRHINVVKGNITIPDTSRKSVFLSCSHSLE